MIARSGERCISDVEVGCIDLPEDGLRCLVEERSAALTVLTPRTTPNPADGPLAQHASGKCLSNQGNVVATQVETVDRGRHGHGLFDGKESPGRAGAEM